MMFYIRTYAYERGQVFVYFASKWFNGFELVIGTLASGSKLAFLHNNVVTIMIRILQKLMYYNKKYAFHGYIIH